MIDTCPFCNEKMYKEVYESHDIICFSCICTDCPGWFTTQIEYDLIGNIQMYWYLFNIDGYDVAFLGQKKSNSLSIKLWEYDIGDFKTIYQDTWREFDGIDDIRIVALRLLKLLPYT